MMVVPALLQLFINLKNHTYMAFKEAELADHPGVLRVIIYNPTLENVPEILGITQERQDQLTEITKECLDKANSLTELMHLISKKVENANELSYAMINVGAKLGNRAKRDQEKAEGEPKKKSS